MSEDTKAVQVSELLEPAKAEVAEVIASEAPVTLPEVEVEQPVVVEEVKSEEPVEVKPEPLVILEKPKTVKPTSSPFPVYVKENHVTTANEKLRETWTANMWYKDDLVLWAKGFIPATNKATPSDLINAIYVKFQIPGNVSYEDALKYVAEGVEFEKTKNNLLLNDVARKFKPIQYWSFDELRALYEGELTHPKYTTKESILEVIRERLGVSSNLSKENVLKLFDRYKKTGNDAMSQEFVLNGINKYLKAMNPKNQQTAKEIAGAQISFYRILQSIMNMDIREFNEHWTIILDTAFENRLTVFHDKNLFRGFSEIALSKQDSTNFLNMLNLITRSMDPSTRYSQVSATLLDFDQFFVNLPQEDIRNKFIQYYRVN